MILEQKKDICALATYFNYLREINRENIKILDVETNLNKRLTLEMHNINKTNNVITKKILF